jgi:DNA uptake protein ComE-like DNA-binding protein
VNGHRQTPGFLWALVPLGTFGIGTPPAFVYLAMRYNRPKSLFAAVAYLVVMTLAFALVAVGHLLAVVLGVALMFWCAVIGTAHALAVRRNVSVRDDYKAHLATARESLRRRDDARRLATKDPRLARELGIGRPDLPHRFDDGGLVDMNHSPVHVIADLPGIDLLTAVKIVAIRSELGGFGSVDEMSVTLDLPPTQLDGIADRLLFLRG